MDTQRRPSPCWAEYPSGAGLGRRRSTTGKSTLCLLHTGGTSSSSSFRISDEKGSGGDELPTPPSNSVQGYSARSVFGHGRRAGREAGSCLASKKARRRAIYSVTKIRGGSPRRLRAPDRRQWASSLPGSGVPPTESCTLAPFKALCTYRGGRCKSPWPVLRRCMKAATVMSGIKGKRWTMLAQGSA